MKWFDDPQSIEQLKKQYRQLAKKYHPDMGGSNAIMQEINAEYQLCEKLILVRKAAASYASTKSSSAYNTATNQTYQQKQDPSKTSTYSKASDTGTNRAQTQKDPYEYRYKPPKHNAYTYRYEAPKSSRTTENNTSSRNAYTPPKYTPPKSSHTAQSEPPKSNAYYYGGERNKSYKSSAPSYTKSNHTTELKRKWKSYIFISLIGLIFGLLCLSCSFLFSDDTIVMMIIMVPSIFIIAGSTIGVIASISFKKTD